MRKIITLTLTLLFAAFAFAQQPTAPSTGAPDQPQAQSPSRPGTAAPDTAAPSASQSQSQPGAAADQDSAMSAGTDVIEGCLGGTDPNYTVTAKDGTTYQLKVPQGADVSQLAKHIGESVAVQGTVDKSSTSTSTTSSSVAGSENTTSSSSSTKAIHAMRIRRGTGTCPASGTSSPSGSSSGSSTSNPPSSSTTPPPAKK